MIDPARHAMQIRLLRGAEYNCPGCGRRTRDTQGRCVRCRNARMPDPATLTFEQIVALMDRCRAELKRRQEQITKALEVKP